MKQLFTKKMHIKFLKEKMTSISNTAYAVYRLKADFVDNGNSTEKNWTENTIFRKINGVLKIERIHSTPIETK